MLVGTVCIVGRPNVGKSTLFNRLTQSSTSIVDNMPGVTRDRIYGNVHFEGRNSSAGSFTLIDTGGFETDDFNYQPFSENLVWEQTKQAISESDLVILLFDAKCGLHQHDKALFRYLETSKKNTIYVVNKIDGLEQEPLSWEFYQLGVPSLTQLSAAHNKGTGVLLAKVKKLLQEAACVRRPHDLQLGTKIALIGRPNSGKSSILNRIIGSDRSLVSSIAGTTRDSIHTPMMYNNKPYIIIDTAGIRRRTKIKECLEVQSVVRSLRTIDCADIVVAVIDATIGITDQDARLINLAADRFKPILLVVNKWDLVANKTSQTAKQYTDNIKQIFLKDLAHIPVHFTSCILNQRVHQIMSRIEYLQAQNSRQVSTSRVNAALQKMITRHSPQIIRKYSKRLKFYYATQVRHAPPTIVVMCNVAGEIQTSYQRYMLNSFRRDLGFDEVPLRLLLRDKKNRREHKQAEFANCEMGRKDKIAF